ncbi:MAG: hypothetical protein U0235_33415 [Polyangiaceae bacterium]
MNASVAVALVVLAAAAAACSDGSELDGGNSVYPTSAGAKGSPTSGNGVTGGQNITTPSSTSGTAIPASGPGSTSSAAHQFFVDKVFPSLNVCVTCHATGNLGAPKFLATDANGAYQGIDAHGLIQDQSLLLTKGTHAGGSAPALDANQSSLITQWLALEAKERVGQAAPVNILEKMGSCLDKTLFDAIQFQQLRTTKRDNENANNCTGCNQTPCRSCHTGGDGGFYMAVGSALDQETFTESQKAKYIVKYIGLNGTTPVASNAIKLKGQATTTDRPYSHPMFTVPDDMQARIDAFVTAAITKYQNKQCGQ